MKRLTLLLAITFGIFVSCDSKKAVAATGSNSLEGNWELNYISGPKIAFEGLYPDQKPNITFVLKENKVMGKNSCNNYSGKIKVDANTIYFDENGMISTKMFCGGEGESLYMNTLQKVNGYSISEDRKTLNLLMGDIAVMRFDRIYKVME